MGKQDLKNAKHFNNKALGVDTDFAPSLAIKGRILSEMGDVDDALAAFKTALEQYPAFVQTFVCLGKFFSDSVITYHSEDAVLLIVKLLEKGTIIRPSVFDQA